ncbi:hypothetical protein AMTRI_Chr01g135850 [Amborella trichopoda]
MMFHSMASNLACTSDIVTINGTVGSPNTLVLTRRPQLWRFKCLQLFFAERVFGEIGWRESDDKHRGTNSNFDDISFHFTQQNFHHACFLCSYGD